MIVLKNGFFGPMVVLIAERCLVDVLSFAKTQRINDDGFRNLMNAKAGEKYPGMTMRDLCHWIHDEANEFVM